MALLLGIFALLIGIIGSILGGIIGGVIAIVLGIAAIVCGAISMKGESGKGKGGIVTGIIGILMGLLIGVLIFPGFSKALKENIKGKEADYPILNEVSDSIKYGAIGMAKKINDLNLDPDAFQKELDRFNEETSKETSK